MASIKIAWDLHVALYTIFSLIGYAVLKTLVAGIFNPRSHIPGPWHTRFTSVYGLTVRLFGRKHLWVREQHKKYGPIVRIGFDEISIGHIDPFTEVHRMGSPFRKSELHSKHAIIGNRNLFSMDDVKAHAQRRKLFARAFTTNTVRANWESQVRAKFDMGVEKMKQKAMDGGSADVLMWWRMITTDVIAELCFCRSFGMVEAGQDAEYMVTLQNAGLNIILHATIPFTGLLGYLPWKKMRDIMKARKALEAKGKVAIANLRNAQTPSQSIFSNILAHAEADEKGLLTEDDMNAEAALFLLAGSETTSTVLTYLVWAVVKRPDLQRRLEEEVAALEPDFKDEDLEKLVLLNSVMNETLRLYGPATGSIPRNAPPEGVIIGGYAVPGNSTVSTTMWTISRDPNVYPNPEEFDEERFQNPTADQLRALTPFGIGSRSCIGSQLAKMELRIGAALFFRELRGARIAPDMSDDDMEMLVRFIAAPKGRKCNITLPVTGQSVKG